jgi:hypothetical protein
MDNIPLTEAQAKKLWQSILDSAIAVITKPAEFYRGMAKTGGFGDPLIFLVVMGVIAGVIRAVLGLFHLGMVGSAMVALGSIIFVPVAVLIFGFVWAAILYVIWKLMGSSESYETAYRCSAYAAAVSPIMAVVGIIPYVGSLIGLAWMLFLLVTSSVEVHKIAAKTAWQVFGIITAILALMSTCSQIAAHRAQRQFGSWEREFGKSQGETTPEDAAKISAAMMQAMQAEMAKQAKEAKEAEKPADE